MVATVSFLGLVVLTFLAGFFIGRKVGIKDSMTTLVVTTALGFITLFSVADSGGVGIITVWPSAFLFGFFSAALGRHTGARDAE